MVDTFGSLGPACMYITITLLPFFLCYIWDIYKYCKDVPSGETLREDLTLNKGGNKLYLVFLEHNSCLISMTSVIAPILAYL